MYRRIHQGFNIVIGWSELLFAMSIFTLFSGFIALTSLESIANFSFIAFQLFKAMGEATLRRMFFALSFIVKGTQLSFAIEIVMFLFSRMVLRVFSVFGDFLVATSASFLG
jgi:hypothetical protein